MGPHQDDAMMHAGPRIYKTRTRVSLRIGKLISPLGTPKERMSECDSVHILDVEGAGDSTKIL